MEYIPALEPFRGLLATARFDMRVLYELADDPAVLAAELERAGIEVPGTRMAIVAAVRGAVEEQQRVRGPPPPRPATPTTRPTLPSWTRRSRTTIAIASWTMR